MRRYVSSSSRTESTQTPGSPRLAPLTPARMKGYHSVPPMNIATPRSYASSSPINIGGGGSGSRGPSVSRPAASNANADHSQPTTIPSLRDAITSLESKMASLMSERRILESRLEQAVRLQSPVQRLPSELLGSIFAIGVLEMEEEDSLLLSTLMLVCKYWTEVALNTPVLWSRINVGNHDSLVKARRKLSRSKSVPLEVCIQFSPRMEHASAVTELVVHAMDILRPSMWRWRSFRLAVPNRPQAHAALMQCKDEAPLLEELSVQIFHFMQDDHYSTPPLPLFDANTPKLRSCSFTSFNFGWDPSLASKLRVLKLGGYWHSFTPSVDTVTGILRACPLLEELALRNMSDIDPDSCEEFGAAIDLTDDQDMADIYVPLRHADMITLPRLKKATFYYAGVLRVHAIFTQLSFPALERVEFSYLDNLTPILKHLKRQSFSSLPLRHLRIESSFFNELRLVRLLRRLPSLHTLELVDVEDISSNFLRGLSSPPVAQSWICPKLETLNLDGCTTMDWDALRALVESRLPANTSRRFNVSTASAFPHDNSMLLSSASSYAQAQKRGNGAAAQHSTASSFVTSGTHRVPMPTPGMLGLPKRLRTVDVTRCHQISKEMLQWLRMYVSEVRCETAKSLWGENGFS